ncbi:putative MFS family arabinose efflux permease [Mangrovibacterium diazotrophicum]|uniref:Putative MFS family arabinose efflux permease n=2 Tax=Mangrovibacterium diazotrophicum TaxID=1261403 RepID=A0A419WBC0_9BACT|nr:putative MFS family arabinose efflux permease [Mangrovibacterium diazotrophicum]
MQGHRLLFEENEETFLRAPMFTTFVAPSNKNWSLRNRRFYMSKTTRQLANIISVTLGMRLFSMLIIIPFLSVYALNLEGGAPWLTGYALGIFGLTQAVLQIPFGMLSDRIGYKKMMLAGLIMLIVGLLTAAYATSIYWLIFARALQGSGAIVTVGYSWISSAAGDEERDKQLTRLGAVLGTFTMLSYLIGPLVHIVLSVSHMFVFSAVLIAICFVWVLLFTKQVDPEVRKLKSAEKAKQKSVFNRRNLMMGLMLTTNNLMSMAFFFMLPMLLTGVLETNRMWMILTPAILCSVLLLPVFSRLSQKGKGKITIGSLFIVEGLGFGLMYIGNIAGIVAGTILLTTGTFAISTIVPMLANRGIDNQQRGKGNGIIVSLQYVGSFLGAALTGTLWNFSPDFAFVFTGLVALGGMTLVATFPKNKQAEAATA